MNIDPWKTPLMVYLKNQEDLYYGKIRELRDAVQKWLEYIPETFLQYTRHTVQHSDEIIVQLSKLLFRNDDPNQPVVKLTAIEAYILAAAAYLHDAGMVLSDKEKMKIMESSEWKSWISGEGGGARRWLEIRNLRENSKIADEAIRHFLADIQTRFLIAEYVRRSHHLRGGDLITVHHESFGRFAFDDPILLRTIVNVCVGHGLIQDELKNHSLYPERCDILGQKTNVLFLAILLRIGDLLDMSSDRACPLLLSAACPLPSDSLAHWTKYRRIQNRLTSPDRIELAAKCHTQEEHRFLQDWCQWLVNEIHEAGILMSHAPRHDDWKPPFASINTDGATIEIGPAEGATYIPSRWTFVLDQRLAFHRLITDAYEDEYSFVLELIQNGLDANRCQMYVDLKKDGLRQPDYPTQVDEDRRRRYPINISLRERRVQNELSGEMENRQVLIVEDSGIGMDREVIERYLLQVGHSYYRSDEFRRSFRFVPSSYFGVGFLSVFSVSDHVVVETHKPISRNKDGPIRLTLTGPQNYLLMEHGEAPSNGTRIEVILRKPLSEEVLSRKIIHWCKRVELPVILDFKEVKKTILAERPEQFTYEMLILGEKDAKFAVKSFPLALDGVEGELYVFCVINKDGEYWDRVEYATSQYPSKHLQAKAPPIPRGLTCVNGIAVGGQDVFAMGGDSPICIRVDVRNQAYFTRKHRWLFYSDREFIDRLWKDISPFVEELLRKHLSGAPQAKQPDFWIYQQGLISAIPLREFWRWASKTIRTYIEGKPHLVSLAEVQGLPTVTTTLDLTNPYLLVHYYYYKSRLSVKHEPSWDNDLPTITSDDIARFCGYFLIEIFAKRRVKLVRWLRSNHLAVDWELGQREVLFPYVYKKIEEAREWRPELRWEPGPPRFELAALPGNETVGFYLHETGSAMHLVLNRNNDFVQWLERLSDIQKERSIMTEKELHYLLESLRDSILYYHDERHVKRLNECLVELKGLSRLPADLRKPVWKLSKDKFRLGIPESVA